MSEFIEIMDKNPLEENKMYIREFNMDIVDNLAESMRHGFDKKYKYHSLYCSVIFMENDMIHAFIKMESENVKFSYISHNIIMYKGCIFHFKNKIYE